MERQSSADRAKKSAEEMRGFLSQLDKDELVDIAIRLYENGERLRFDLDDLTGTIR